MCLTRIQIGPEKYISRWKLRDGRIVTLRPIEPEDEPLWLEMFRTFSKESIRYRFFEMITDIPQKDRIRYCNVDLEREIAIVAELNEEEGQKIIGVVRTIIEPYGNNGEIAFIVADPWQGLGLGFKMVDHMIEICKERELETINALMLPDNHRAIRLLKKMGFSLQYFNGSTLKGTLDLKKEEPGIQRVTLKSREETQIEQAEAMQ